jgi:hypothetical protein
MDWISIFFLITAACFLRNNKAALALDLSFS